MIFDNESARYIDSLNRVLSGYIKLVNSLENDSNKTQIEFANSIMRADLLHIAKCGEKIIKMYGK